MMWLSIIIAALFASILIIAEHYFPWFLLLGHKLPRPAAYTLGVLAIALPLTVLLLIYPVWNNIHIIIAFWAVVVGAGLGTFACYTLDNALDHRTRAREAETRENSLLGAIK